MGISSSYLLDAVYRVIMDWKKENSFDLWPDDTPEAKRRNIELCFQHKLITLLTDSKDQLEGFLIFYRDFQYQGMRPQTTRMLPQGPYVVSDVLWVRPDLRKSGTLRRLLKKAFREHREKVMGGEKIVLFRKWNNYKEVIYDFPKFFRKYGF